MGPATKEPKRYDGHSSVTQEFIKADKADKSKLIDWLRQYEETEVQQAELEQMEETLPAEIDTLLSGGKMDGKTIEKLATKRAHLDLLPGRMGKLDIRLKKLEEDFHPASVWIEEAVRKAGGIFYQEHLDTAIRDLMQLGVERELAEQQALLRPDIQAIVPMNTAILCSGITSTLKARNLLWAYEAFEQGFHPNSPAVEKIKKSWRKNV